MIPTRLAIDVGTSSTRAIVIDDRQQVVCSASEPLDDGCVEQDVRQILQATSQVIGDVLRQCRQANGQVVEAGMATQRSSVLLWEHSTGTPLTLLLSWQDRRTSNWLQQRHGTGSINADHRIAAVRT